MSNEVEPLTKMEKLILRLMGLYESNHSYESLGEEFERAMEEYINGS